MRSQKNRGGKIEPSVYTASNVAISTNSYTYMTTGKFLFAKAIRNEGVSSVPTGVFYVKQNGQYTQISNSVNLAYQTTVTMGALDFIEGEIYMKVGSGPSCHVDVQLYYFE